MKIGMGIGLSKLSHVVVAEAEASTLLDGLTHAYTFNDTLVDAVGSKNLSSLAAAVYATGKSGKAYDSNVSNGLYYADNSIHPGAEFTYSWWVKHLSGSGLYSLSLYDEAQPHGFLVNISGTAVTFGFVGDSYKTCVDTFTVGNDWRLVTIWGDATNIGLQVDARTPVTNTKSGTTLPTAEFTVTYNGTIDEGGGSANDEHVDDLCIWSRVLTSDERAERWNDGAGKFYPFE